MNFQREVITKALVKLHFAMSFCPIKPISMRFLAEKRANLSTSRLKIIPAMHAANQLPGGGPLIRMMNLHIYH